MIGADKAVAKTTKSNHEKTKWKLKFDYMEAQTSGLHKGLDAVLATCAMANNPSVNLTGFLQETVNLLAKTFKLRSVSVGRVGQDGLYRYEVMCGISEEAWKFLRAKAYVERDFYDGQNWNGDPVGRLTKVYLVEDDPWIERDAFNRPSIVGIKRRTPEDWVEGDYIDTHIRGTKGELLGWIEILGVNDGKMPDVATLKFLETVAGIIGRRMDSKRP